MDIIFSINVIESSENNIIVLNTFEGKNKVTKKGYFSGPLRKIDFLNVYAYNNLTHTELLDIKDIFINNNVHQVKKYEYHMNLATFIDLFHIVTDKCFYWYGKEKKYNIIYKLNYKSRDNSEYKDGEYFNFEDIFISYNDKVITLTYIDENKMIKNKACANQSPHKRQTHIKPYPILMLEKQENRLIVKLFFNYEEIRIPSNSKNYIIKTEHKEIYRDLLVEKNILEYLNTQNISKISGNTFSLKNKMNFTRIIDNLIQKGFKVYYFNGKEIISSKSTNYSLSYGIDWFNIEATSIVDGNSYDLSEYIDLNSNKKYVEIKDKVVLLPIQLEKHKKEFDKDNGKIILPKQNLFSAIELSQSSINETIINIENFIDYSSITLNLNDKIKKIIRSYQKDGVKWLKWLYQNGIGGCLADDMGLGKTLQIISLLSEYTINKDIKTCLIIVPKSLLINWLREIKKFSNNINAYIYHGVNRKIENSSHNKPNVIITTAGTAANDIELLKKYNYSLIIFDEIQMFKNNNNKIYKKLNKLTSHVRIGLSGTPLENNLLELWSIMNLLNPGKFTSKREFYKDYSNSKLNLQKLRQYIQPFILRRTKQEVLLELPPKAETTFYCDMTTEQRLLYSSTLQSIQAEISKLPSRFEIKDNSNIFNYLLYLRQICCHPNLLPISMNVNHASTSGKFEALKIKLRNIYQKGDKVLVFSQFTSMLKIIESWLIEERYNYYYLDGNTNNRQAIVDEFEGSDKGIFLISLKAGGTGLNLTSARYVIIYDPWWNPAVEKQAADRVHRIGQTQNVTIYKMITINSIEENIFELQNIKKDLFQDVIEGLDSPSSLTIDEIKKILI